MENNELMLKRYGTTDSEKIKLMMETLFKEKKHQRVEGYVKLHPNMDLATAVKYVVNFARHVGRERAMRRKYDYATDETITERAILSADKKVLTDSFVEQGYPREVAEELVDNNYFLDDIWGIKSLNAEDYTVYGGVLVQKPEKERYARLLNMQAGLETTK